MARSFGAAPSVEDLEFLAQAAFRRISAPFARHLEGITVSVEDFADDETLQALGLEDGWELTGLYHGRPLEDETIWTAGEERPHIILYRQPLLAEWCETGVSLDALVTHVVIHEVGHHFGLSDEQMHDLEGTAED